MDSTPDIAPGLFESGPSWIALKNTKFKWIKYKFIKDKKQIIKEMSVKIRLIQKNLTESFS